MKVFYGSIYVERNALEEAGIEHPIKLEYYKTINKQDEAYGINIVKTEYKKSNIIIEEKEIKHLSQDESKIEKLLKLFKSYAVTPITAQDIADDLLKQSF